MACHKGKGPLQRLPQITSYCCTSLLFSAASIGMSRPRLVDTPCLYATCLGGSRWMV